jgi:hypothetical protein
MIKKESPPPKLEADTISTDPHVKQESADPVSLTNVKNEEDLKPPPAQQDPRSESKPKVKAEPASDNENMQIIGLSASVVTDSQEKPTAAPSSVVPLQPRGLPAPFLPKSKPSAASASAPIKHEPVYTAPLRSLDRDRVLIIGRRYPPSPPTSPSRNGGDPRLPKRKREDDDSQHATMAAGRKKYRAIYTLPGSGSSATATLNNAVIRVRGEEATARQDAATLRTPVTPRTGSRAAVRSGAGTVNANPIHRGFNSTTLKAAWSTWAHRKPL